MPKLQNDNKLSLKSVKTIMITQLHMEYIDVIAYIKVYYDNRQIQANQLFSKISLQVTISRYYKNGPYM